MRIRFHPAASAELEEAVREGARYGDSVALRLRSEVVPAEGTLEPAVRSAALMAPVTRRVPPKPELATFRALESGRAASAQARGPAPRSRQRRPLPAADTVVSPLDRAIRSRLHTPQSRTAKAGFRASCAGAGPGLSAAHRLASSRHLPDP